MLTPAIFVETTVRPARVLALVDSPDEFRQAVSLFCQLWGGNLNPILPSPTSDQDEAALRWAMALFNPDFVVTIDRDGTSREAAALAHSAYPRLKAGAEEIARHGDLREIFRIRAGELPHVLDRLSFRLDSTQAETNIRLVYPAPDDSLAASALFGRPSEKLADVLMEAFGAREYRSPTTVEDWMRLSALRSERLFVPDLGRSGCGWSQEHNILDTAFAPHFDSMARQSGHCAYVFLVDDGDTRTASAWWNCAHRNNSFVVPRASFLEDPGTALATIPELWSPQQVVLVADTEQPDAEELLNIARASVPVQCNVGPAVLWDRVGYAAFRRSVSCGTPRSTRTFADSDGRYGIVVEAPDIELRSRSLVGIDVQVRSDHGERLELASLGGVGVTLGNSQLQISRALENQQGLGSLWLRQDAPVRPFGKGLSSLAIPNREFAFWLHPEDFVVRHCLRGLGLVLKPHRPASYAMGFIRRTGGMRKAMLLAGGDDLHVLMRLVMDRQDSPGLLFDEWAGRYSRDEGKSEAEAKAIVGKALSTLLEARLVFRGLRAKCAECDMDNWYPLGSLDALVTCAGCQGSFRLPDSSFRVRYAANELADRFLSTGGRAVLEGAYVLKRTGGTTLVAFGGTIDLNGETAEVDLAALTPGGPVLAECKSIWSTRVSDLVRRLRETEESVGRLVALTAKAGLYSSLLCVSSHPDNEGEIQKKAHELAQAASTQNVRLDLILNKRFFLSCADEHEPYKIRYPTVSRPDTHHLGESLRSVTSVKPVRNQSVLARWDAAAIVPKE